MPMTRGVRGITRRSCFALLACVPASAFAAGGEGRATADGLKAVIGRLQAAPRLDRAQVEQALGTRLTEQGSNRFFAIWVGGRVALPPLELSRVELREPKPGAGATGGPIVVLTIGSGCLSRTEVDSRFGPLDITGVPRGRSPDEETSLSRQVGPLRLSFGFPERNPICLKSVSLSDPRAPL